MRRSLFLGVLLAVVVAPNAAAQSAWIESALARTRPTLSATLGLMEHRVVAQPGYERALGPVFGAQVDVVPMPNASLSLRVLGGTLDPRSPAAEAREVGELDARARLRVLPWLDAGAGASVRSFTSTLARQKWTQFSIGAESRMSMLSGRIIGLAGASLIPAVRVSGQESPTLAIAAVMGIRSTTRQYELGLDYTVERYDFPTTAGRVKRAEGNSVLAIRAGYRFRVR
jgi:hypothetical protein